jgi:hypothetical protein
MGLTGRYDFKGIQKAVRRVFDIFAATTSFGAWLVASPFKPAIDVIEDLVTNWLINRGLIVIDIGAVMIEGKVDQALLDNALDLAFEKLKVGRDKITPQEGSKIDAETTQAFDQFADIHSTNPDNDGVPNVSSTPL